MGQRLYAPGFKCETAPYQLQPEPNPVEAGETSYFMSPYKAPESVASPVVAVEPSATPVVAAPAAEKSPKVSIFSKIKADIKDLSTSAGKFAAAFERLFKK